MMTPGTYLRLRREAAALTLEDAASMFAPRHDPQSARHLLADAEADRVALGFDSLVRLGRCFPFDHEIYGTMVADLPTRPVCEICACSYWDPCHAGRGRGTCAWADATGTICTRCASVVAA